MTGINNKIHYYLPHLLFITCDIQRNFWEKVKMNANISEICMI